MKKYIAILLLCATSLNSYSREIQLSFQGSLTSIYDQYGFLSGQFSIGDTFSGSLTYETNTPEDASTLNDPTVAIYSAVKHLSVNINGFIVDGSQNRLPGYMQVWDNRAVGSSIADALTFSAPQDRTPPIPGMGPGIVVGDVDINLFDFTHSASHNGTQIPDSVFLSNFESPNFSARQVNVTTNRGFFVSGTVKAVTVIPEPSTYQLMALGLLMVLSFATKRPNHSLNRTHCGGPAFGL